MAGSSESHGTHDQNTIARPTGIRAIRPGCDEIEKAWLYEHHFGHGRHAIRFDGDGMNAPFHSERSIAWEPQP